MKKILITGWNGFLGINLTKSLLKDNYNIYGVSRSISKYAKKIAKNQNFKFIETDLTDNKEVEKLPRVDIIIHLAGNASAAKSYKYPRQDFENNVIGTFNILEYCRLNNSIPLILASTAKIYPLEDMASRALYGASKYAADIYAQEYMMTYNLPIIINRFVTLYGSGQYHFGQPDRSWVNWFIEANLIGKPIQIAGDGKQKRDPLFIEDAVDLIKKEIKTKEMFGNIFDVGAGRGNITTPRKVIDKIEEVTGKKFKEIKIRKQRIDEKNEYFADMNMLKEYWKPKTHSHEGIIKTSKWISKLL